MTKTVAYPRWRCFALGVLICCGLTFAITPVWGQSADATVIGQVTDESGAVLPGVTVTVSSSALQVKQVVNVTSANGEYRVTPLPLGTYTVEFTLPGFQTLRREGLVLTAGFVAKVDVSLKVGAVEESVTVSGVSPVVDVKTTTLGTQVTRELLDAVPTARNSLISLLTLASGSRGLVDAGQIQGTDTGMKAFGRIGDSWTSMEGVATTSPTADNPAWSNRFDIETFEEADIRTIGGSAEAPTAGVQVNIIMKSGSNDFHGGGIYSKVPTSWQSNNIDDALRARGINDPPSFDPKWDVGGDLGGRIVRDRLWFYGSARARKESTAVTGSYNCLRDPISGICAPLDGGAPALSLTEQRFWSAKGTGQLTSTQKLIGSYSWQTLPRHQDHSATGDSYQDWLHTFYTKVGKAEWQIVKGNKLLSVQGGFFSGPSDANSGLSNFRHPNLAPDVSSWTDSDTKNSGGLENKAGQQTVMGRKEIKSTLNWYKPDLFMGNHDFKAGVSYAHSRADYQYNDNNPAGNYSLTYKSGAPSQVSVFNFATYPETSIRYLGTFVQDSWTLQRRLTLNLGVRYTNDRSVIPAQCRDAAAAPFTNLFPAQCFTEYHLQAWNSLAPRLHAAYDVRGNGKTVIKGGYGRFYLMHNQEETDLYNQYAATTWKYKWKDINSNRHWDAGESNLDPNGSDFISTTLYNGNQDAAGLIPNADFKEQGSDEFSISLERELMTNFGFRVTGVYTKDFNTARILNTKRPFSAYTIPLSTADPGPDGKAGTADDPGTLVNYVDYPSLLVGINYQVPMLINDSAADSSYKTIEVAAVKRLSKGWQLSASYTATKKHLTGIAYTAAGGGLVDPNNEINMADNTWEWMTRIAGSYMLPFQVQAAANVLYQSGDPWARTVSVKPPNVGSINVRVEPIGTQQTDNPFMVTFLAEKAIRMGRARRLNVGVNVINLLNANFITWGRTGSPSLTVASGANFGKPSTIVAPRVTEIRLRYTF